MYKMKKQILVIWLAVFASGLLGQKYKLSYSDTLMLLGEKMYNGNDFMGAIMSLDSCIQLNPRNDQCRYTRGKIAYDMRNFELGKKLFKSVIALQERDAASWNMLGLCYQELRQYDSAEFCFKNAVQINPDESRFFANWGKNEFLQAHYNHAEELYNTAVFLDPNYVNHLKNRAQVRSKLGKKEEALADLKQASETNPNDKDLDHLIGELEGNHRKKWLWFLLVFITLIGGLLWWKKRTS
jgi:tetratricopeptide (TPR) repeat protein